MFAHPCPSCAQRLLAPLDRVGQRTICPKCLRPLTVPAPTSTAGEDPHTRFDPSEPFYPADDTPVPSAAHTGRMRRPAGLEADELPAAVATLEPPSVAITPPPPVRTRRPADATAGAVVLNPTGLFAVDVAAELSATLSMRMAPPPAPATDRRLVMAAWVVGTAAAAAAWVAAVLAQPGWFVLVTVLGAAMTAFGVLWRAHLCRREGRAWGGLLALVPPLALLYLARPCREFGLRPLAFVLTGLLFCGLAAFGPAARAMANDTFQLTEPAATKPAATPEGVLAGLKSADSTQRKAALANAAGVATPEVAEAVAARVADRDDRAAAKASLVAMGGMAEPAAIKLLAGESEAAVLIGCEVLEAVGGEAGLKAVRTLADGTSTRAVRLAAADAAAAITVRQKTKG